MPSMFDGWICLKEQKKIFFNSKKANLQPNEQNNLNTERKPLTNEAKFR